jgi:hypothetical protein
LVLIAELTVYDVDVAPVIATLSLYHWYVGVGVPVASADSVNDCVRFTVAATGCVVNVGGTKTSITVTATALLSVETTVPLTVLLADTLYVPASARTADDTVYVADVAPDIATLFLNH